MLIETLDHETKSELVQLKLYMCVCWVNTEQVYILLSAHSCLLAVCFFGRVQLFLVRVCVCFAYFLAGQKIQNGVCTMKIVPAANIH